MKTRRSLLCALAGLVLVLLLAGCSNTTLSGSWKDPGFQGQVRKVYLVGIANQEINRRIFEDAFAEELATLGVTGIPSYRELAPDQLDSKEAIGNELRRTGVDAILMARMTDMRTEEMQNPDYVTGRYYPGFAPAPYYRSWDSYYDHRFEALYQSPKVTTLQIATIEANLYDAGTGRLIWAAQLKTLIDSDIQTLVAGFVKNVAKDLRKQGLL